MKFISVLTKITILPSTFIEYEKAVISEILFITPESKLYMAF